MADLNYPEDILFGSLGSTVRKKEEKKLHTPEHVHVAVGKRKNKTRSCEKCRHLERGTHVPNGRIPQREEVEMVWTCAKT